MKILICFLFIFALNNSAEACKRSAEAYEQAVKKQLKLDWKALPQFHLPEFRTLPYILSSITKDSENAGNYILSAKRGETICKQIIYGVVEKSDCSIETTILSIQGCPN